MSPQTERDLKALGVKDSKAITFTKRSQLLDLMRNHPNILYASTLVSSKTIDQMRASRTMNQINIEATLNVLQTLINNIEKGIMERKILNGKPDESIEELMKKDIVIPKLVFKKIYVDAINSEVSPEVS